MTDYQDHYYPSEMAVDAQIQTFPAEQGCGCFPDKSLTRTGSGITGTLSVWYRNMKKNMEQCEVGKEKRKE